MTFLAAIVGRPNVGKSTLFNRLTKTRQALVDDLPGVTRDRLYGRAQYDGHGFTLIDTGGFDPPADQDFAGEVHAQIETALAEADLVLFLTDGRAGLNPLDQDVANKLRRTSKPVFLVVNKIDGPSQEDGAQDFHALGLEPVFFVSAAHGYGVGDLLEAIARAIPEDAEQEPEDDSPDSDLPAEVRIALLGRPNVGKSSLLNALVGEKRVVVSPLPGTTRDAIDTPFVHDDKNYMLIDTAGIRRQGRVSSHLEKAGVFRSLRAIDRAHVVIMVLDASQSLADQDLRLLSQIIEAGRGLIIALNKMDLVQGQAERMQALEHELQRLPIMAPWAPLARISAQSGRGVNKLLPLVDKVFAQYNRRIATGPLNQALESILSRHQPPSNKGRRVKFFYATQASVRPPTIVLFVNAPQAVHFSYRRYLNHELRAALNLDMSPLRLIYRQRKGK